MLSLKVLFISAALMFAALGLKASLPVAAAYLLPLWTFFLLCSTPPYLFVILNAIIISIVASSKFHHSTVPSIPLEEEEEEKEEEEEEEEKEEEEEEEKKVIQEGITMERTNSTEIPSQMEKPLVSARFSHRKFLKSTSEGGRALRVVAKAKRHETLENTWKAITEGRSVPLSRHMKKSDTWQISHQNKSEDSPWKLRKEPSLSQDELNRRVEAFINKFNEEMRLQRQESLEQYMQMINRGAA